MKAPWIVAHDGTEGEDAYAFECLRCGQKQKVALPISIKAWVSASKDFCGIHEHCMEVKCQTIKSL